MRGRKLDSEITNRIHDLLVKGLKPRVVIERIGREHRAAIWIEHSQMIKAGTLPLDKRDRF